MIPIIDLTGYLAGEPNSLDRTAREIRDALSRIGITWWTNENYDPRRQKDIAA